MFQPHLVDVEQPGVAGKQLLHVPEQCSTPPRDAFLYHPIRSGRRPNRTIQTRRPLWWFKYVPRVTLPSGEGDEAAVPHTGTQR